MIKLLHKVLKFLHIPKNINPQILWLSTKFYILEIKYPYGSIDRSTLFFELINAL